MTIAWEDLYLSDLRGPLLQRLALVDTYLLTFALAITDDFRADFLADQQKYLTGRAKDRRVWEVPWEIKLSNSIGVKNYLAPPEPRVEIAGRGYPRFRILQSITRGRYLKRTGVLSTMAFPMREAADVMLRLIASPVWLPGLISNAGATRVFYNQADRGGRANFDDPGVWAPMADTLGHLVAFAAEHPEDNTRVTTRGGVGSFSTDPSAAYRRGNIVEESPVLKQTIALAYGIAPEEGFSAAVARINEPEIQMAAVVASDEATETGKTVYEVAKGYAHQLRR